MPGSDPINPLASVSHAHCNHDSFLPKVYFILYPRVFARVCVLSAINTHGGQKRVLDLLQLELHIIMMWVLGIEPESSGRAVSAHSHLSSPQS